MSQPAFPNDQIVSHNGDILQYADTGMDLRDYFAAKAMSAMLMTMLGSGDGVKAAEITARAAYGVADAMLKARME